MSYDFDRTLLYHDEHPLRRPEPANPIFYSDWQTLTQVSLRETTSEKSAELLVQRYDLIRMLGRGGVGEVWEARQGSLQRSVAVKRLAKEVRDHLGSSSVSGSYETLFHQEALTAAQLDHPNIVPVYDLVPDGNGMPQLAMKLVRGRSWKELIEEDRHQSITEILTRHLPILVDVAQAVAFAHSRGIVHRDLKPTQVMVGDFGEVYLMDWGLSLVYDPERLGASRQLVDERYLPTPETASSPAGTAAFMAPEQTLPTAEQIGPWTDIFLLGATLYYLLTGQPPHTGATYSESFQKAIRCDIPHPSKACPDRRIPDALSAICMRALAKLPPDRYASTRQFLDELRDYLTGSRNHRESEAIAAAVEAETASKALPEYRDLVRSLSQLDNSRALWPENPRIPALREVLLTAYARAALRNKDLKLAQVQAEQLAPGPERRALLEDIEGLERKERVHAFQRRFALATAAAMLGALFLVTLLAIDRAQDASHARRVAEDANRVALEANRAEQAARAEALERAAAAEYGLYLTNVQFAQLCLRDGRVAAAREYLSQSPPALRNWEWGFLMQSTEAALGTLTGHTRKVNTAQFGLRTGRLLTSSRDHQAILWDPIRGEVLHRLAGHGENVEYASFDSLEERVLTVSDDQTARLWDARSGELLHLLKGHTGNVAFGAFSPAGDRVVTASIDNTARVWDAETGAELHVLRGHEKSVVHAVFDATGARVVTSSSDGTARLWDAVSGAELVAFRGHGDGLSMAAVGPDGRLLATASLDHTARLWNLETGEALRTFAGHSGVVLTVDFNTDGSRLLTASMDHTARVWETATGQESLLLEGHQAGVKRATFSPDSATIATASMDNRALVWNAKTGRQVNELSGHSDWVYWATHSPDGSMVATASKDGTVGLWRATLGGPTTRLTSHAGTVTDADFSPDGRLLATSSNDSTLCLWNLEEGRLERRLQGHQWGIVCAEFSPGGTRLVSASFDETARLWDLTGESAPVILAGHHGTVVDAHFSADGSLLGTASEDGVLRLWDGKTGEPRAVLEGHDGALTEFEFSPGNQFVVSTSTDGTARVWSVSGEPEPLAVLRHDSAVRAAHFAAKGGSLITGTASGQLHFWDPRTGERHKRLSISAEPISCLHVSPAGDRVLACSEGGRSWLLAVPQGDIVQEFTGHGAAITAAAFSPDGSRIVTGSRDQTAKVWDARTGRELLTLAGHGREVVAVQFSPDGQTIVTASADNTACLWHAAPWQGPKTDGPMTHAPVLLASAGAGGLAAFGSTEAPAEEAERSLFVSAFGELVAGAHGPLTLDEQLAVPAGAPLRIVALVPSHLRDKTLSIAGSHPDLGDWEANKVPMDFLHTGPYGDLFEKRTTFQPPLTFKMTLGHQGEGWTGTGEWAGPPDRVLPHPDALLFRAPDGEYLLICQFGTPPDGKMKLHDVPPTWMTNQHQRPGHALPVKTEVQNILGELLARLEEAEAMEPEQGRQVLESALEEFELRMQGISPEHRVLKDIVRPGWRLLTMPEQEDLLNGGDTITLMAILSEPSTDKKIHAAGNTESLGSWIPNQQAFTYEGTVGEGAHLWTLEVPFEPMEFKLTHGQAGDGWIGTQEWAGEPNRRVPSASSLIYVTPEGDYRMVCLFGELDEATGAVP